MSVRFRTGTFAGLVVLGSAMACGEPIPVDPSWPMIMTVWMRPLIDQFNQPVPFGGGHISTANRIWYFECRISLHERRLPEISIIGEDEFERSVQLGEKFYDDYWKDNTIRLQLRRIRAQHMNYQAQTVQGYLGANLFSTKLALKQNMAQTAYGMTELGVNATIIIPNDQEPYIARSAAHELGHQLRLEHPPYGPGVEADKWLMHEDIFSTGPNLSGWEDPQSNGPAAGSECERARQYGMDKYYLFYNVIQSAPLP